MDIALLNSIKENIKKQYKCTSEELDEGFDKQILTNKENKDGEKLAVLRSFESKDCYGAEICRARYRVFTPKGKCAGYIDVVVMNVPNADEVEIIYQATPHHRRKGNITISMEEVLKDVFVSKSFDGVQVRPTFPKTKIEKAFLSIQEGNIASKIVAEKNGFVKTRENHYELTKEQFIERVKNDKEIANTEILER